MSVRIVLNYSVKSGTGDQFILAWAPEYDRVNAKPGCLQYELFRSTRNPDNFAVLEHWETRKAFEDHWQDQWDRPRAGAEFRDAPENRKVGKSGFEIYYEVQSYKAVGSNLVPA